MACCRALYVAPSTAGVARLTPREVSRDVKTGAKKRGALGYVEEDNSGRANIFGIEPKQLYTSSPTSDRAARQGLGGTQGLAVVGAALALVALATLGVAKNPGDTLGSVSAASGNDSLAAIASRLK